ncbi:MAG: ribonuclease HII [Fimbriimonas sp.]
MPLRHTPSAAGADEAGRGPLAGPVVAAAVILPRRFNLEGIDDSKKLTRNQREELEVRIKKHACWSVVVAEVDEVDRLNILWASMAAMHRAVGNLEKPFKKVYIDGNTLPKDMPWTAEAIVDGDAKLACIAAASILAKTERDRIMTRLAPSYPKYGFDRHFGYSTPEHLEALRLHGPCEIHRRSFQRIKEWYEQPCLIFEA